MSTTEQQPACIDKYEILDILGQGGMGIVFLARDGANGQKVALKTVRVSDVSFIQSIRREIQALARIEHPGIIRIMAEGLYDGMPWYAMEYLEAATLNVHFRKMREMLGTASLDLDPTEQDQVLTGNINERSDTADWWTASLVRLDPDPELALTADYSNGHVQPQTQSSKTDDERLIVTPKVKHTAVVLPDELFYRFIDELLATMIDLCHALAYLHGQGIVHRDLKPHNIMVRTDGSPVIVDFGLSAFLGNEVNREVLSSSPRASGTLMYMAPEQFRNEQVDARADLYSLGCILYEYLLGYHPYPKHQVFAQLTSTSTYDYPLPSKIDQRFPLELDDLLKRLLIADPRFRLGYATDVMTVLTQIRAKMYQNGDRDPIRYQGRPDYAVPAKSYLYRPGFTGRREAISIISSTLQTLLRGQGELVLIGGESGVGKTRFAQEICRIAVQNNVQIMTGECLDQRNRPMEALSQPLQWIADSCRSGGAELCQRIIGHRARVIGLYAPSFLILPGLDTVPEPVALDAESSRYRVLTYLREIFLSIAREKPTLLVLDDLQWADDLTLHFLNHLRISRAYEAVPLLVLGTYRLAEQNEGLVELVRAEHVLNIELKCLEQEDIDHMISDMLALFPLPDHLPRLLHQHAEGNPFFIAEMLRSAIGAGLLSRDYSGGWFLKHKALEEAELEHFLHTDIPGSIYELVARRLTALSPLERSIIECGAIIGRQLSLPLVRNIFGEIEETVFLKAIKELLLKQVLEEIKADRLAFVHDKIREVVLRTMSDQARTTNHRLVALTIEQLPDQEQEEFMYQLGDIWRMAGDMDKARSWYLIGARAAIKKFSMIEAHRLYRAVLELMRIDSRESLEIRLELINQPFYSLARQAPSHDDFTMLEQGALQLKDPEFLAKIYLAFVSVYDLHSMMDKAKHYLDKVNELAQTNDLTGLTLKITYVQCTYYFSRGEINKALELLDAARGEVERKEDKRELGHFLTIKALYLRELRHLTKARACFEEAIEIFKTHAMVKELAVTSMNLGGLLMYIGENDAALPLLQQATDILRKAGSKFLEACSVHDLGMLYYEKHEFQPARTQIEQALAIFREMGNIWGEGGCLISLASISIGLDKLAEAQNQIERALDIFQKLDNKLRRNSCLLFLATLFRWNLEFDKASNALDQIELDRLDEKNAHAENLELLFQRGYLAMARHEPVSQFSDELERIIMAGPAEKFSSYQASIRCFQETVAAYRKGRHDCFFAGELISSLPESLQARLKSGPRSDT
ncbi:protein kinase [bacterium]|nr:protein kinase [bacterium]